MTHEEELMEYLLRKKPDATVKDWIEALKEIEEEERLPDLWMINKKIKDNVKRAA